MLPINCWTECQGTLQCSSRGAVVMTFQIAPLRWKRDARGRVLTRNQRPVLEFVCVERTDGGGWAIPGGMVTAGEHVSATLKREFGEEALNTLELTGEQRETAQRQLDKFFAAPGMRVFAGCAACRACGFAGSVSMCIA